MRAATSSFVYVSCALHHLCTSLCDPHVGHVVISDISVDPNTRNLIRIVLQAWIAATCR